MTPDYHIIGQGLAGSLLAWELIQRNARVKVIDDGRENASQVAAGLINPITGLRLAKSERVDQFLPSAITLYRHLSRVFGQDFYMEKPMLRLLRSETEVKQSRKRLSDPDYSAYLSGVHSPETLAQPYQNHHGALEQRQTGHLNTRALLGALRHFLIDRGSYHKTLWDHRELTNTDMSSRQAQQPRRVIFCEGYRSTENPWFSWLPLQPVKGEILTLETGFGLPEPIVHFGNWLLPTGPHRCRTGATFERERTDTLATVHAKRQLMQALIDVDPRFTSEARIIEQQAQIRPCTPDRRPFIGCHPEIPSLWIFNGFGAKGSLQIPWYSRHFADVLLNDKPLENHCNIERFYDTHFFSRRSA